MFSLRKKIRQFNYNFRYRKQIRSGEIILGKKCTLHFGGNFQVFSRLGGSSKIELGDNCYIGRYFNLHTGSGIKLGANVVLSDYVYISTIAHGIAPTRGPIMSQEWEDKGAVVIGDNCFIGFGAKILPNVQLGEWCVVGAGSVVTKSFPPYSMLAGNPAKVIKRYDKVTGSWLPYK